MATISESMVARLLSVRLIAVSESTSFFDLGCDGAQPIMCEWRVKFRLSKLVVKLQAAEQQMAASGVHNLARRFGDTRAELNWNLDL